MKKSMLFAAAAVVAMVGCTNEDFTGFQNKAENGEAAISFGSVGKTITRAEKVGAEAADALGENFVVEGFKSNGYTAGSGYADQTLVFDHYNVNWEDNTANSTASNSANWEYVGQDVNLLTSLPTQTIKYWDYNFTQYDFIAFSKGKDNTGAIDTYFKTVQIANVGEAVAADGSNAVLMTQEKHVTELMNMYVADLFTSYKTTPTADYQNTVKPKFRRFGAKVRMALYETVPGYSVKNVKFYADATTTTSQANGTLFVKGTSTLASGNGTMYVYYPTVGADKVTDKDYNQAHVVFKAAASGTPATKVDFAALTGYAGKEYYEKNGTEFLGRTSAEATYAGDYQMVLPTGTGNVLSLRVDYTLESVNGDGETIEVRGATAEVPAIYTEWQPNYAYTYIFKISDQTNGTPGTVGTDPAGLYPITFDAVIAADVDGGVQETITEVGVPAITTYQKGKIVTENDEYLSNAPIYAVVNALSSGVDAGTPQTLLAAADKGNTVGFVQLFKATTSGAIETITEKTANNCFFNGTVDGNDIKILKDANLGTYTLSKATEIEVVDKIIAADAPHGVEISVSAAKITPAAAGTVYVLQTLTEAGEYAAATAKYHEGETYYNANFVRLATPANVSTALSKYYVEKTAAVPATYKAATGTFHSTDKIKYYTSSDGKATGTMTEKTGLRDGDDVSAYFIVDSPATPATYEAATGFYEGSNVLAADETEYNNTPAKQYYTKSGDTYTKVEYSNLKTGDASQSGEQVCTTPAKYAYKVIKVAE